MIVRRRWLRHFGRCHFGLLILPAFDMKIGNAQSNALATSGPAWTAFTLLRTQVRQWVC